MSDPTDWAALGTKVQKEATEESVRIAKEQEAARKASMEHIQQKQVLQKRAEFAIQELREQCNIAIKAFNSSITQRVLMLKVVGVLANTFSVEKGDGLPSVTFEIEAGKIDVTLKESYRTMGGTLERYGVDDEGKFTIRNGAGIITAQKIVDYWIKLLIGSQNLDVGC